VLGFKLIELHAMNEVSVCIPPASLNFQD